MTARPGLVRRERKSGIADEPRFFNEARAVNRIDHPSLVQVSDYGQLPDGMAYIVMEYLKGETLGQRMKRTSARLPTTDVIRFGRQICTGLAAAHEKEIVHRDLKPDEVSPIEKIGQSIPRLSEAPGERFPVPRQAALTLPWLPTRHASPV